MKIKSVWAVRDFWVEQEAAEPLKVAYKKWYSNTVVMQIGDVAIEIRPKNIWQGKFNIFKNGQNRGEIIFNWRGGMIIQLLDDFGKTHRFRLVFKGFFKQRFELFDGKEQCLLLLKPIFTWRTFTHDYIVETFVVDIETFSLTEILAYSGFCAKLYFYRSYGT